MQPSPRQSSFERDLKVAIEESRRQRGARLDQLVDEVQAQNLSASWDDLQPQLAAAILDAGLREFAQIDRERGLVG
ncbi:hypothetical protein [Subtercola sp. YIM 133946]|uniref:hypothetical protein n=1 Tax=Subtercola sp. YIM 133946 TaxID=3118909 RepID=UPI002F931725